MEINQDRHKEKIKKASIIIGAIGLILIIISYKTDGSGIKLFSYLSLNLGGLLLISGAYTLISELYLKKNFAEQIQISINKKLEQLENNQNIANFGLINIEGVFEKHKLYDRIKKSKKVCIFSLKNQDFFNTYAPELKELIENQDLVINIYLFNPNSEYLENVKNRFVAKDAEKLKSDIQHVIDYHIKERIYDPLSLSKKQNLVVKLFDRHPTYSAYIFDDEEYWFIPNFYRKERRPVPIFIFKENNKIRGTEFYKDFEEISKTSEIYYFK